MSHGSKKWIEAYDGKLKRSNDRTQKDYWRDLRWWEPMEGRRWKGRKKADFCPQCKHVSKATVKEEKETRAAHAAHAALRDEYEERFGALAEAWHLYRVGHWRSSKDGVTEYNLVPRPREPEPPHRWEWITAEARRRSIPPQWSYDTRSYLCYKCERKYEMKMRMWDTPSLGWKERYNWCVKQSRRDYRAYVRNKMQRQEYDDIDPRRHEWLD